MDGFNEAFCHKINKLEFFHIFFNSHKNFINFLLIIILPSFIDLFFSIIIYSLYLFLLTFINYPLNKIIIFLNFSIII